jgi:SAM-dependent methyltransferase
MKIDIGCGAKKRAGYAGVDLSEGPGIDYGGIDFNSDPLPFEDNSVERVFSSHAWEHVEHPMNLLREILRVCRQGAEVELWMPYGHSDDAFILGHHVFYTPEHWRHFVQAFPDTWQGPIENGRYRWDRVRYNVRGDVQQSRFETLGLDIAWAVRHLNNIAWEFGVLLTVQKDHPASAPAHQPVAEYGPGRFT